MGFSTCTLIGLPWVSMVRAMTHLPENLAARASGLYSGLTLCSKRGGV